MKPIDDEIIQFGSMNAGADQPPCSFQATERLLRTHLAIFGGTRMGKSKLFEHLCRQLMRHGRGLAFIDPHSETADDLLTFLACHQDKLGLLKNRIHYLSPYERPFCYDPFHYVADPGDPYADAEPEKAYRRWLSAKIKDMVRIITRKQGETEEEIQKTVLLQRWLFNGLYAVGVRLDSSGRHLRFWDLWIILNPSHPDHEALYGQVCPHLETHVRLDFETILRPLRSQPARVSDFIGSTINRLRAFFSPTTLEILSGQGTPIDFRQIIANNGVILAPLGKRLGFHQEEGQVIAGLLIREIADALMTCEREKRRQFYLFIDEAQNFLGQDLQQLFKESAKYKLSLGLAVQALDNLQRGELDLVPTVLGQCGIRITFQQQYQPHAEELAKSFCYPTLDFTELLHEVDRDDGYEWVVTASQSTSKQTAHSRQSGTSRSYSVEIGSGWGESVSHGRTHNVAVNQASSKGSGLTNSTAQGLQASMTAGISSGDSTSTSASEGTAHTTSEQDNFSLGVQSSQSESSGNSESISTGTSRTSGTAETTGRSASASHGESAGTTRSANSRVSNNQSVQEARSDGINDARSFSSQESSTVGESSGKHSETGESHGSSAQFGHTDGTSNQTSQSRTFGRTVQSGESHGIGLGVSFQSGESESQSLAETRGIAFGFGGSDSIGIQRSHSLSNGISDSQSNTTGVSQTRGESTTYQPVPLKKIRVEMQRTGQLAVSINDQVARHTQQIMCLDRQTCLVAIAEYHTAFVVRIDNVADPFEDLGSLPAWKQRRVRQLKDHVFRQQPYFQIVSPPPPVSRTSPSLSDAPPSNFGF